MRRDGVDGGARPALGFAGICLGYFAIILDGSVLNLAVPVIRRDLGSTMAGAQWVLNAYTLVLAALLLTAGALGDRIGHRRLLLGGLALFTTSSMICALAGTTPALVASRAVQGLGAAALLPATLALVPHLFPAGPRRERATVVWVAIGAAAMAVGPFTGGMLIAAFGWRSIFLLNLPVGVLGGFLVWTGVRETSRRDARVDHLGQTLAAGSLGLVTAGLISAGSNGWTSPVTLGLLGAGAAAAGAFAAVERRVAAPLLPPAFLGHRVRAVAVLSALSMGVLFYGALFVLSLYFQQLRGWSPAQAGAALLPYTVGPVLAPLVLYRPLARRFGHPRMLIAGFGCSAAGSTLLASLGARTGYPLIAVGLLLAGGASTVVFSALTSLLMSTIGAGTAGLASGIQNTARQAGALLGVAVFGSVLTSLTFAGGLQAAFVIMVAIELVGIVAGLTLLRAARA
ncbi:MAG: MFS transporter [Candidatus Dormibacteraeota bacterium]|nr:MFS transporter [Candidatus Dormibacteraeota bacterium]